MSNGDTSNPAELRYSVRYEPTYPQAPKIAILIPLLMVDGVVLDVLSNASFWGAFLSWMYFFKASWVGDGYFVVIVSPNNTVKIEKKYLDLKRVFS